MRDDRVEVEQVDLGLQRTHRPRTTVEAARSPRGTKEIAGARVVGSAYEPDEPKIVTEKVTPPPIGGRSRCRVRVRGAAGRAGRMSRCLRSTRTYADPHARRRPRARAWRVQNGREGGLVCGRNEDDIATHHIGDGAGEERVVRAAEQQGIDLASATGASRRWASTRTCSESVSPRSTNSTKPGHAAHVSST